MADKKKDKWDEFQDVPTDKWSTYEDVPAAPREKTGVGRSALRGFNQAISLGLWDEIESGLRAAPSLLDKDKKFSEEYRRIRDQERAANAQALQDRPLVYGTGSAAGALPFAGGIVGQAGPGGVGQGVREVINTGLRVARKPTLTQSTVPLTGQYGGSVAQGLKAAAPAGIVGGVQGIGDAPEMSDVPADAARGAALNALLAGTLTAGAPVLPRLARDSLGGPDKFKRFKENYNRLEPKINGKLGPTTTGLGLGTGAGAYYNFGPGLLAPESTAPEDIGSDPYSTLTEKAINTATWGIGFALGGYGLSKLARAGGALQATRRGEGGVPAVAPAPAPPKGPVGGGTPPKPRGPRPGAPVGSGLKMDAFKDAPINKPVTRVGGEAVEDFIPDFSQINRFLDSNRGNPTATAISQASKKDPAAGRQVAMQAQATPQGRAATNVDSPVRKNAPEGAMGMVARESETPYKGPGMNTVQQSEDEFFKQMQRNDPLKSWEEAMTHWDYKGDPSAIEAMNKVAQKSGYRNSDELRLYAYPEIGKREIAKLEQQLADDPNNWLLKEELSLSRRNLKNDEAKLDEYLKTVGR
jgi:hypothetical protein